MGEVGKVLTEREDTRTCILSAYHVRRVQNALAGAGALCDSASGSRLHEDAEFRCFAHILVYFEIKNRFPALLHTFIEYTFQLLLIPFQVLNAASE